MLVELLLQSHFICELCITRFFNRPKMSVMWDFGSCKNISPYKMEIDRSNFYMDVWEIQQLPYIILHKKDSTIFNFQLSSKQHQAKKIL